jgi:hypothetical protein
LCYCYYCFHPHPFLPPFLALEQALVQIGRRPTDDLLPPPLFGRNRRRRRRGRRRKGKG